MTETEIKPLSEKKREIEARIETMDDPTMGTEARADELREELDELEQHTPESYRLTQEIFQLREEREELDGRLDMMEDPVMDADEERVEELREDRADVVEKMKKKQNKLRTNTAIENASKITGGDR